MVGDFWNEFFGGISNPGGNNEDERNEEWSTAIYKIHLSLITAGFSVDQAFEILKLELGHTHSILQLREAARIHGAHPGH